MASLRIMIVDDSALTRKKLVHLLEEAGHQVVAQCESGQEALLFYPKVCPDLVTMDIAMPNMNGIQATQALLKDDAEALIVVVTAHGQEQMVIEAIEAGAKGYLLKPIRAAALCETLEKVYQKYALCSSF